MTKSNIQLTSTISEDNKLTLALQDLEIPQPGADEVVIRVEAAPLNPSDLAVLFSVADMSTAKQSGTEQSPAITADVPAKFMPAVKTCLVLKEGTTAKEGASSFVNPLTALAMVETMRAEGHKAIVHAAAASSLGQMLNRICIADGVDLINIVRKAEQETLLRDMGAKYVINSSSETFLADLTAAIIETGATIAFDPIGGGKLTSDILNCMEVAASRDMTEHSVYGSDTFKQVYIYGALDRGPITLNRNFGFAWAVNGFLLFNALGKLGTKTVMGMRKRVADEITTTFASKYTHEVSLAEALQLKSIAAYSKQATGEKYLITPQK